MEEVIRMLNEESRRKIRELKIDELVDILDDQEHRLDVYAPMSFDDRLPWLLTNSTAGRTASGLSD